MTAAPPERRSPGWSVERHIGRAASLHTLPDPPAARRVVRIVEIERPALVLGSSQSADVVDHEVAAREGLDVVRRRSGGGAVLLRPGDHTWVDLLVPAGDPLWEDDVVAAAWWVGKAWAGAVDSSGWGPTSVHTSGLVKTEWSGLICFAGLGPGEVSVGDHKLVGVSQRRSRDWVRVQTVVFNEWEPGPLVDSLALTPPQRRRAAAALEQVATAVSTDGRVLVSALLANLPA